MSYDIYLTDRISGETIKLPIKHMMTGGTYRADYDPKTKTFTPVPVADAWLNITYNYSNYYYAAAADDERFYGIKDNRDKNIAIMEYVGFMKKPAWNRYQCSMI